jgi:hypothetical protein
MAAEKYSASMDNELLDQVRAAAAKQGVTVSAWLAHAADHQVRLEGLRELVAEWEAEHGVITGEELEAFDREVVAARKTATARKTETPKVTVAPKASPARKATATRKALAGRAGKVERTA